MWNVFQDILLFKHTNGENHIYGLYQLSKNGSKRKDIQTYLFRHLLNVCGMIHKRLITLFVPERGASQLGRVRERLCIKLPFSMF